MTGENWNGIMVDCMLRKACIYFPVDHTNTYRPDCPPFEAGTYHDFGDPCLRGVPNTLTINRCSPHPLVSVLYFCSYLILISYMLLQVGVCVCGGGGADHTCLHPRVYRSLYIPVCMRYA